MARSGVTSAYNLIVRLSSDQKTAKQGCGSATPAFTGHLLDDGRGHLNRGLLRNLQF